MRSINRGHIGIPAELNSHECQIHLFTIIANPDTDVDADLYKGKRVNPDGSISFTVRETLKTVYDNKCAYCEKFAHAPKIDHHRPKGRVVGTNAQNKGYYWLCYEWTNLLPSCTDCNTIDKKGSKFPVRGARRAIHPTHGNPPVVNTAYFPYNSVYNTSEQPLLLHPEYCTPTNNFSFDKTGRIIGQTPEGIETIVILQLDNPDLNGWRRKIYEQHLTELQSIVRRYFRINNPISEVQFEEFIAEWVDTLTKEANNQELEYTLFRKSLLNRLDYFFISELDPFFQEEAKNKIVLGLLRIGNN
ncbi:MAG TPA: hypothetical protein PKC72_09220 [Chitinophagaceae bacterium]|nr:hypothetical protein [Chitinophagaceae bacterium]